MTLLKPSDWATLALSLLFILLLILLARVLNPANGLFSDAASCPGLGFRSGLAFVGGVLA